MRENVLFDAWKADQVSPNYVGSFCLDGGSPGRMSRMSAEDPGAGVQTIVVHPKKEDTS